MEFTGVYTLHGRRIVALENICDHAAAVEAVGLAG
jgi:nitrite reductase/ring-hydroxylating ferredoxin subunit